MRGGFGISYAHYTRAGSGDILGINAPQAQFASVTQISADHHQPLLHAASGADYRDRHNDALLLRHRRPGLPQRPGDRFNSADRQHHLDSQEHAGQLCGELLPEHPAQLSKNTLLDLAYVGNRGLKLQGFLNANQKNPVAWLRAALRELALRHHRGVE